MQQADTKEALHCGSFAVYWSSGRCLRCIARRRVMIDQTVSATSDQARIEETGVTPARDSYRRDRRILSRFFCSTISAPTCAEITGWLSHGIRTRDREPSRTSVLFSRDR